MTDKENLEKVRRLKKFIVAVLEHSKMAGEVEIEEIPSIFTSCMRLKLRLATNKEASANTTPMLEFSQIEFLQKMLPHLQIWIYPFGDNAIALDFSLHKPEQWKLSEDDFVELLNILKKELL